MNPNSLTSKSKAFRAVLVLCGILAFASTLSLATTITVTNVADAGDGTLRQAILDANADLSPDPVTIEFNVPGAGVHTITPLTALPIITRPVTIDGYSQPGASPNALADVDNAVLRVAISGTSLTSDYGLRFNANDCTVRGLVINGFAAQVLFEYATNGVVEGNFLGTDASGTNRLAGSVNGVQIISGAGHRIGGVTPAARNVISGNSQVGVNVGSCAGVQVLGNFIGMGADGWTALGSSWGMFLGNCSNTQIGGDSPGARNVISGHNSGCWIALGDDNVIEGNFFGTDASGTQRRTNRYGLVLESSPDNRVGGSGAGEGNLFSGNESAVLLDGVGSSNNVIAGNLIGTDITGTNALGNLQYGVAIVGGRNNTVGGMATGARNVICGNDYAGVAISYPTATGNVIEGNYIGLDVTGTNALPSSGIGVAGYDASDVRVGGSVPGARNVIARNFHGIGFYSGSNHVVQGNFIGTDATGTKGFGNSGFGIYLNASGSVIGGDTSGAGNLSADNGYDGIYVGSPGTIIQGNSIGTDVTGTNALFNGWGGIEIDVSAPLTQVGGTNPAARNVISGNSGLSIFSSNNIVQGNYLGIGPDGSTVIGNPGFGINIAPMAQGNLIGGDGLGEGNLVSGWFAALRIAGSNNVVQGNLFGTDSMGTLARSIQNYALTIWGQNNLIGGVTPGARNLICASHVGIDLNGNAASGNTIQGNYIGTDITGTNSLGNYQGIAIEYAPANLIGGTNPAARNVIAGNSGYGLGIGYDDATNNVIQGNYFGVAADGITPLPNYAGVRLFNGGSGNLIGGLPPGAGNVIAHHTTYGVSLIGPGVTNNTCLGNRIFGNGWRGIDLAEDGVTANDVSDADDGVNHLQNHPEIANAQLASGGLTVRYRVDSALANATYPLVVEFFLADSVASAPGKVLLHRHTYSTPQAFANITFTPLTGVSEGDPIVATATDAKGNTSEFSSVATVTVNDAPLVANPIPNQNALYGSAFNYTFPANAFSDPDVSDTLSYSVSGLPSGIVFTPATRTFSGAPTESGNYSVTVTATDDGLLPLSADDVFEFVVAKASLVVTANNKSKLQGQANPPLNGTIIGVTNSDNVTVSFETTATLASPPGSYPITPVFSDPGLRLSHYTVATNLGTLTVVDCSALVIKNASLPSATRGVAYNVTFAATNGSAPYSFAVTGGALPGDLSLASSGQLSGTPTNAGTFPFTVSATDALGCAVSSNYNLTVVCPTVTVNPVSLLAAIRGIAYNQSLSASGGTSPYTFAVTGGALPDGVSLSSAGDLTGTPTTVGGSLFIVTATDAGGCTGSRTYSINVTCPTLTVLPFSLPAGYKGVAYNATFTTTNGIAPYFYARSGGALPGGLALNPAGVLSGTPTNTGFFNFTILSTDAGGCSGSRTFNMIIEVPPPNRWVGDGTANEWNFTASNWSRGTFQNHDEVLFDDMGSNNVPINLTTLVSPAAISVGATLPYVFSGSGGITGTGVLSKASSGDLILTASNSYSGPTRILGGTVTVRHNNALGTTNGGTVIEGINAGVRLDGNGLIIPEPLTIDVPDVFDYSLTNGALINLAHTNTWSGPITIARANIDGPIAIRPLAGKLILNSTNPIAGPGHMNIRGDGDLDIESGIASNVASLYAGGAGIYTLTGTNASSGTLSVGAGGRMILRPWSIGSGTLQGQSGGTIEVNAMGGNAAVNNWLRSSGGKFRVNNGTVAYNGLIELNLLYGYTFETATASDRLVFNSAVRHSGSSSGFPGTVTISGPGTVTFNAGVSIFQNGWLGDWIILGGTVILNHTNALSQRAVGLISANLQTAVDGGTYYSFQLSSSGNSFFQPGRSSVGVGVSNFFDTLFLGQLTIKPGSNLIAGSTAEVVFGEAGLGGDAVLSIENQGGVNARVTVMGGVLDDNRAYALTKAGAGTLVLAGHSFYSGGTVVSNGTLRVSNASGSATGPGAVTLHGGARLAGVGRISGTVTVRSGGTLAPGDSLGTLTISNHLVLEAGSTNAMELNLATLTNDKVVGLSNVTYGGTLMLTRLGATPYANGNAIKLFDAISYSGSFTSIEPASPGAGLQWDTSTLTTDGTLRVSVALVTPAPFVLTNVTVLPGGPFQFDFANTPGTTFTMLSSTNLNLSLSNWTALGPVTEISPGQFQFTDAQATNGGQRFYRARFP